MFAKNIFLLIHIVIHIDFTSMVPKNLVNMHKLWKRKTKENCSQKISSYRCNLKDETKSQIYFYNDKLSNTLIKMIIKQIEVKIDPIKFNTQKTFYSKYEQKKYHQPKDFNLVVIIPTTPTRL
jgi:hypothetical protein